VLAVEGNRIKLSRKAILKEQRAKMGGDAQLEPVEAGVTFEGGHEAADEPNYNRADNRPRREGDRDRGRRHGHGGRGDRRGPRR